MKVNITKEDIEMHELRVMHSHAHDAFVKPNREDKIKSLTFLMHSAQKLLELYGKPLDGKVEFVFKQREDD